MKIKLSLLLASACSGEGEAIGFLFPPGVRVFPQEKPAAITKIMEWSRFSYISMHFRNKFIKVQIAIKKFNVNYIHDIYLTILLRTGAYTGF